MNLDLNILLHWVKYKNKIIAKLYDFTNIGKYNYKKRRFINSYFMGGIISL